ADVPGLRKICQKYGAALALDDAHSVGVLGPNGEGTAAHYDLVDEVDLIVGTFSKSLASIGGFAAGSETVIHYLRHHSRPLIFTAALPPANTDGRGLDRFIAFPYDHYRHDPLWVPQLRRDVRILLSPDKNPFWEHAEAQYWLAVGPDGRTVGRIGAIKNDMHNKEHHDRVGFYGFFESINDRSLANALFDTAAAWLRAKGFDTMRGPMNPSTNDDCGLLIKNDGTPPSLMMPYNFSYYEALHEHYGFTKAKDLLAYDGGGAEAPERTL